MLLKEGSLAAGDGVLRAEHAPDIPNWLTVFELFLPQLRAFAADVTRVPAARKALVRQRAFAAPTEMPSPTLGHGDNQTCKDLAMRESDYQS